MSIKGKKVNPVGWRVGVHRKWKNSWFQEKNNYARFLLNNLNINELVSNTLYYNHKNLSLLKSRVIGLNNNQLYIELYYFQKKIRNKRKKKQRLFLLDQYNAKQKLLKHNNLVEKAKDNNIIYKNAKLKNKFLVFSFLNNLNSYNKNILIPQPFNNLRYISNGVLYDINVNKNNSTNFIKKIQKFLMNKNMNDLFITENNSKLLKLQKTFAFNKLIRIKDIDSLNTKTTLFNLSNKLNNKTNSIKNIFKLYIIMVKLNKLNVNNNFIDVNFIVNKSKKVYNDSLYENNVNNNLDENNIFKVISSNNKTSLNNLKDLTNMSIKELDKNSILTKNYVNNFLNKDSNNQTMLYRNFYINKKKFNNNINALTKSISVLSGYNTNLIFINVLSFMRFKTRLISNNNLTNINSWERSRHQKQLNLLKNGFLIKSLERFFKYRYPGIYAGNMIYTLFFCLFLKNPYTIVKTLGASIEELPKNNRQIPFIRLILRMIARLSGSLDEIEGLRIQFKGRFDKWNRTKSILFEVGKSIPKQTFSIFIEYGATKGFIKKGTYGIRLWIQYKPSFVIQYKDYFEQYWAYSKFIAK